MLKNSAEILGKFLLKIRLFHWLREILNYIRTPVSVNAYAMILNCKYKRVDRFAFPATHDRSGFPACEHGVVNFFQSI